jgi:hypothetical protein
VTANDKHIGPNEEPEDIGELLRDVFDLADQVAATLTDEQIEERLAKLLAQDAESLPQEPSREVWQRLANVRIDIGRDFDPSAHVDIRPFVDLAERVGNMICLESKNFRNAARSRPSWRAALEAYIDEQFDRANEIKANAQAEAAQIIDHATKEAARIIEDAERRANAIVPPPASPAADEIAPYVAVQGAVMGQLEELYLVFGVGGTGSFLAGRYADATRGGAVKRALSEMMLSACADEVLVGLPTSCDAVARLAADATRTPDRRAAHLELASQSDCDTVLLCVLACVEAVQREAPTLISLGPDAPNSGEKESVALFYRSQLKRNVGRELDDRPSEDESSAAGSPACSHCRPRLEIVDRRTELLSVYPTFGHLVPRE